MFILFFIFITTLCLIGTNLTLLYQIFISIKTLSNIINQKNQLVNFLNIELNTYINNNLQINNILEQKYSVLHSIGEFLSIIF